MHTLQMQRLPSSHTLSKACDSCYALSTLAGRLEGSYTASKARMALSAIAVQSHFGHIARRIIVDPSMTMLLQHAQRMGAG